MIFRLCLFLLAGAIVNVAVAWGCCLRYTPGADLPYNAGEANAAWWLRSRPDGFSDVPFAEGGRSAFGWESVELYDVDRNAALSIKRCPRAIVIRSGWPILALEGSRWIGVNEIIVTEGGLLSLDDHVAPCRPLWPGF